MLRDLAGQTDYVAPFELYSGLLGAGGGRERLLARLGPDAADPIEEFLSLALAYERENTASLEGFLHWLMAGEIEIKRDLEQAQGAVRLMTVHGAKGLEAPVVILPDTLQVPNKSEELLWVGEDKNALAVWRVRAGYDGPVVGRALQAQKLAQQQEYRRLLYVALTRAKDRLYLCGWNTQNKPPAGNWYELVEQAMSRLGEERLAESVDFDFTGEITEGWAGPGWRFALGDAAWEAAVAGAGRQSQTRRASDGVPARLGLAGGTGRTGAAAAARPLAPGGERTTGALAPGCGRRTGPGDRRRWPALPARAVDPPTAAEPARPRPDGAAGRRAALPGEPTARPFRGSGRGDPGGMPRRHCRAGTGAALRPRQPRGSAARWPD